jgi:hypothetical protein
MGGQAGDGVAQRAAQAMATPAAVACTAPQAPSARPLCAGACPGPSPRSACPPKQAAAEADQRHAGAEQRGRLAAARRRSRRRRPAGPPGPRRPGAWGRRRAPAAARPGEGSSAPPAISAVSTWWRPRPQLQDLAAVGLQDDVLHVEGGVPRPTATRKRARALRRDEARQVLPNARAAGRRRGALRVAGLLLPQRHDVEAPRSAGRRPAPPGSGAWLKSASSRPKSAPPPTMPSSSITYISATTRGRGSSGARSVASARPAVCTSACRPRPAGRPGRADWPSQAGPSVVAGQQQQRERHDRQAAELQQRAHPDVGHAAPAEAERWCRSGSRQRAERRGQQRQRHHQRHQPGGHAQLDDHHAVERAHHQHRGHAHRDLEQRQAQQARQRQLGRGGVGKGQKRVPSPPPSAVRSSGSDG